MPVTRQPVSKRSPASHAPDFRAVFESLAEAVVLILPDDPVFTAVAASDAYLRVAGVRREELVGRSFFESFPGNPATSHADEFRSAQNSFRRVIASRAPHRISAQRYEIQETIAEGGGLKERYWDLLTAPVLSGDGSVEYLLQTVEDVTGRFAEKHDAFPELADGAILPERQQDELRQQWHIFDTALSHTPDFNYILDLEARFTYANRPLLRLWQKSLEEIVGKTFDELGYPPELAKRLQQQVQEVVSTKESLRDQTPFAGATGEVREYEYIFVPVLDGGGQVEAVAGSTRDITDRNSAEQLVQEDNRRWRELLQEAPAAIAVLRGPEHRFEWVNAEYLRLVDRHSETMLLGKGLREAMPEIGPQHYADMFDRVYETGEAHEAREALVWIGEADRQMKEVYVNFVCLPTRNRQGQIDGTFVHATDVTDLVKARKHIEEREQQFRTLAETIPHLAWMADETGHIVWYNRRWYDYTGTDFKAMEGWGWEQVHDPKVLPSVLKRWKVAISSGEPFDMVFPLKGADGAFRSFLTRVEPVKDKEGRVVRWFGTNTDITEQRTTEEELRRINRELEEFAYVASHDLQEPLRMVNIYTQLLLKNLGSADSKLDQYAGFVKQSVGRMQELIQDLLMFSRTVQREELPVGTADISASVREALSVLKSRIEESGAVITTTSLPAVRADTKQLMHVFENLIANSLKYRRPGEATEIRISGVKEDAQCIISVSDNGIGFEQKYAEYIFGLFKRLHKDDYPGTGLGLAICQRIIERYRGRMWAEGKPDEGATFYFSLPSAEAHEQA